MLSFAVVLVGTASLPAHAEPQAVAAVAPAVAMVPRIPIGHGFGRARISIPAIGLRNRSIISHHGSADDGPGTVLQNRGHISAPWGKWGGVDPGQIGNLLLVGHRTSGAAVMRRVPSLKKGDLVRVAWRGKTYTYEIAYRLLINFRKKKSRDSQSLQVPGKFGVAATRPAIVLSTCATPEDARLGLRWRDANGNPTHRISLVGYLVGAPTPAP